MKWGWPFCCRVPVVAEGSRKRGLPESLDGRSTTADLLVVVTVATGRCVAVATFNLRRTPPILHSVVRSWVYEPVEHHFGRARIISACKTRSALQNGSPLGGVAVALFLCGRVRHDRIAKSSSSKQLKWATGLDIWDKCSLTDSHVGRTECHGVHTVERRGLHIKGGQVTK